ncbi:MAG TPA: hypothetical protein VHL58_10775 [Thermoanaerobaculia bacterium]|nr:hypothetical protein [Thermoanaerobaculia bacterium]
MLLALLLFFLPAGPGGSSNFPSLSSTSWMSPDSFHLSIGMGQIQTLKALRESGWKPKEDKSKGQFYVEYSEGKTLTLSFSKKKLQSLRFEYVDFLPAVKSSFSEQKEVLAGKFGKPRDLKLTASVLIYDHTRPNVFVVLSAKPNSDIGKQGLGYLVVRYFDPSSLPMTDGKGTMTAEGEKQKSKS